MRKTLPKLPSRKHYELHLIRDIILREAPKTGMIILFGSYARGGWVEDKYQGKDLNIYEYKSDFDILALVEKGGDARCYPLHKISSLISSEKKIETPVSLIVHTIDEFNEKIRRSEYFFYDVKKEGALLFDSGKFKLERLRKVSMALRYEKALRDYNYWSVKAEIFYETFLLHCGNSTRGGGYFNMAAFELHQAAEHAYTAVILAFTGYKPKLHDLEKLGEQAVSFSPEFLPIFPRRDPEEKRLFELLKRAYVDARYDIEYKIAAAELDYLGARVKDLHAVTEKVCGAKLAELKSAAKL